MIVVVWKRAPMIGMALLIVASVSAQEGRSPGEGVRPPMFDVSWDTSFSFAGTTRFRDEDHSKSSVAISSLRASGRAPLGRGWFLPLSVGTSSLFFDSVESVPVESDVHTAQLSLGLGYRFSENWFVLARVQPMLYRLDNVGSNDLGFSTGLLASWSYSASLRFRFGLLVAPDSDLPVLPNAGLEWDFLERWTLHLTIPRPRVSYALTDEISLHVGASMRAVTFRSGDDPDFPSFDDALANYREVSLGLGGRYRLGRRVNVEAEFGYAALRQLEYTRLDERVRFNPSLSIRFALRIAF